MYFRPFTRVFVHSIYHVCRAPSCRTHKKKVTECPLLLRNAVAASKVLSHPMHSWVYVGTPRRGCGDPLSRTSLVSRHNPPREHVVSCATGTAKKAHMVVFLHRRGTDFVGKMKGRYFGLFSKKQKRMCEGVSMQPKKASLVILSVESWSLMLV